MVEGRRGGGLEGGGMFWNEEEWMVLVVYSGINCSGWQETGRWDGVVGWCLLGMSHYGWARQGRWMVWENGMFHE